mmetsp:Transcript_50788/g.123134  ORF Transcript_50788/g.123134 Transcript_50788/m.123134 type:complete len:205 (-) Transcript_50788:1251-1865(-)
MPGGPHSHRRVPPRKAGQPCRPCHDRHREERGDGCRAERACRVPAACAAGWREGAGPCGGQQLALVRLLGCYERAPRVPAGVPGGRREGARDDSGRERGVVGRDRREQRAHRVPAHAAAARGGGARHAEEAQQCVLRIPCGAERPRRLLGSDAGARGERPCHDGPRWRRGLCRHHCGGQRTLCMPQRLPPARWPRARLPRHVVW